MRAEILLILSEPSIAFMLSTEARIPLSTFPGTQGQLLRCLTFVYPRHMGVSPNSPQNIIRYVCMCVRSVVFICFSPLASYSTTMPINAEKFVGKAEAWEFQMGLRQSYLHGKPRTPGNATPSRCTFSKGTCTFSGVGLRETKTPPPIGWSPQMDTGQNRPRKLSFCWAITL